MVLGPQFEQLKMLMTPREILGDNPHERGGGYAEPGDLDAAVHDLTEQHGVFPSDRDARAHLWSIKSREANSTRYARSNEAIIDSVEKEGVKTPVSLWHDYRGEGNVVYNGHHRLIAQFELNPDKPVAVEHHDNYDQSYRRSDQGGRVVQATTANPKMDKGFRARRTP